jgi:hypothetical protein
MPAINPTPGLATCAGKFGNLSLIYGTRLSKTAQLKSGSLRFWISRFATSTKN